MQTLEKVLLTVVICILVGLFGIAAYDSGQRNIRAEAVERGYGEWKVGTRGNEVKFVWKKQ